MSRETIYMVQSFHLANRNRIRADAPIACKTAQGAIRTAERLALNKLGVMAFSTSGDAESGEYDDEPVIFFRTGQLPEDIG
jgi:hypothetical protein